MSAHAARQTVGIVRFARALGTAKRPRLALPRQHPPAGIERDYARALARLVSAGRGAWVPLFAELPHLLESAARARRVDADPYRRADAGETDRIKELVEAARAGMAAAIKPEAVEKLALEFAAKTQTYQRIQLERQTRAALGADVFIADRALAVTMETYAATNVALIKGLTQKVATDVEALVLDGVSKGQLWEDLAKDLQGKIGFPEKRAKLIARDQVGKFYGQVNAQRQTELGITRFTWRTVHDPRVRPEHHARDGKDYSYAEPRGADGELPGEAVNCRCSAEPIFDDLLADLESEAPEPEPQPEPRPAKKPKKVVASKIAKEPKVVKPKPVKVAPVPPVLPEQPAWIGHASMADARTSLQADLESTYGMAPQTWRSTRTGYNVADLSKLNANGVHHWDGTIELAPDVAAHFEAFRSTPANERAAWAVRLQKAHPAEKAATDILRKAHKALSFADVEAVSTFVHEEVHGMGAITAANYTGAGVAIEEIITETSARRYMTDRFGVPRAMNWRFIDDAAGRLSPMGGYRSMLDDVVIGLSQEMKISTSDAVFALEEASLGMKRLPVGSTDTGDSVLEKFLDFFPAQHRAGLKRRLSRLQHGGTVTEL